MSEERLDRIEASLAGLATKGDIEVAVATAVAGLATKAELAGIAKNVEITALGHQVLTLTAQVRDLQQRFTAIELRLGGLENRFAAMEGRFAVQEERMTGMLSLLVRVAERIEGPAPPAGGVP